MCPPSDVDPRRDQKSNRDLEAHGVEALPRQRQLGFGSGARELAAVAQRGVQVGAMRGDEGALRGGGGALVEPRVERLQKKCPPS